MTIATLLPPSRRKTFQAKLPAFILEPMTPEDLPEVMTIEKKAYATPWPKAAYKQELLANNRACFEVLRYQPHENQIIGYSGLWDFLYEAHLGTLVSHADFRGQGIGELLLVNALRRTEKTLGNVLTLEVRPSNRAARGLYTKYKFEETGRRRHYYPDREDALIMTSPVINSQSYQAALETLITSLFQRLAENFLKTPIT